MITTTLLIPLLVSSGSAPALQQQTATTPAERTAEDIEVLRRLMVQAIAEKNQNSPQGFISNGSALSYTFHAMDGVTLNSGTRMVPASRAFHIPNQGVFFSLDVQLPVVEAEEQPNQDPVVQKSEAEEEWDRIRTEVRTGVSTRRRGVFQSDSLFGQAKKDDRTWEIDPEAIKDVEDAVLATLAKHAGRVDGLDGSDRFTVALHLSGSEGSWIVQTSEEDEECTSIGWLSGAIAARRAPARKLILQVSMADLRGRELNGGSELRNTALIHSY